MERDALDYIERIDRMGGIVAAIEAGFPQKEIADASYRYQRQVDDGTKTVVGVNRYTMQGGPRPETLKVGPEVEQEQLRRLAEVRATRDQAKLTSDLEKFRQGAERGDNVIPRILDCVRDYATVGEIATALIPVFGTYREVSVI
jgi:methylmalonyl-CoA mutase N-terminal domain/subunit